MLRRFVLVPILLLGCATGNQKTGVEPVDAGSDSGALVDSDFDTGSPFALDSSVDTGSRDVGTIDPDSACAAVSVEAKAELLPVDIIWLVDNSGSMAPAIAQVTNGLNAFATTIESKKLDYKVIMLSKRGTVVGSRYPVCIPPPLAGDAMCGNGPRFFQSNVDIKSTQPLEQFLGTLDQTLGYALGDSRGGDPWKDQLRDGATKSIVVVTDDNSRLTAPDFELFPGGKNPVSSSSSLFLPPGILDPSRKGAFDGYLFHGVYGWGSETEDGVLCTYSSGGSPAAAGSTYTKLVKKTGGTRAKICDDAAVAWPSFLDAVASAVVKSAKLSCSLTLPAPSSGMLDPSAVNVEVSGMSGTTRLPKTKDASSCGSDLAWYYDNDLTPTKVNLCPAACTAANDDVGVDKPGKISILFGCATVIK